MSYNIDGKLANQKPKFKNFTSAKCTCEKCSKILEAPKIINILVDKISYSVRSYIGESKYIYETKSGVAVTYCSKYCRDKHNHRFQK
jgi:hypothetical protein